MFQSTSIFNEVQNELNARKEALGFKEFAPINKKAKWVAQRVPWVRMTSMARVDDKNAPCIFANTLTTEGTNESISFPYTTDNLPLSGITSVKVQKLGELGTTRKAIIELMIFKDEDLQRVEQSYFIPGMSVRVEWGWSINASDGDQIFYVPLTIVNDVDANKEILRLVKQNPNYDGFQGLVTNFEMDFDANLRGWKCTLEIISATSTGLTMSVKTYGTCICDDKALVKKRVVLTQYMDWILECVEDGSGDLSSFPMMKYAEEKIGKGKLFDNVCRISFPSPERDKEGTELSGFSFKRIVNKITNNTTETFITYELFEKLINFAYMSKTINKNNHIYELNNSLHNNITYDSRVMSINLYNCFINTDIIKTLSQQHTINVAAAEKQTSTMSAAASAGSVVSFNLLKGQGTNFELQRYKDRGNPQSSSAFLINFHTPQSIPNKQYGNIYKIWLNVRMLKTVIDQSEDHYDLLYGLASILNDSCGNLWEFEVIDVSRDFGESENGTLALVDLKACNIDEKPPYLFTTIIDPIKGTGSLVKSINLKSKLTEGMKTMALYGNKMSSTRTSSAAMDVNCSERFITFRLTNDGTSVGIVNRARLLDDITTKDCPNHCKDEYNEDVRTQCSNMNDNHNKIVEQWAKSMDYENIEAVKASLNSVLNSGACSSKCNNLLYPFELSVTIDGIGGIKWADLITIDRLPNRYKYISSSKQQFRWQVTAVEHSITPGNWETTINCILRWPHDIYDSSVVKVASWAKNNPYEAFII